MSYLGNTDLQDPFSPVKILIISHLIYCNTAFGLVWFDELLRVPFMYLY